MLQLTDISFAYDKLDVLNGINMAVANGSHVALMGESGCGKSTLLKMMYGLYDPLTGTISFNGVPILGPKFRLVPGEEYIKYLAQDFDLMPYITVAENVGKYLSNIDKPAKKARIAELLKLVEMTEFADIKAQFLSGGQQQRVALAKALALEPQLLLLDEPFSQIDTFRANNLRRNIYNHIKRKGITCIVATHDRQDVLSYADTVIVMKNGVIIKSDTPENLYKDPESYYVASLFGHVNQVKGHLLDPHLDNSSILAYPHQLQISDSGLAITIVQSYFNGSHYLIEALYDGGSVFFNHAENLSTGMRVTISLK